MSFKKVDNKQNFPELEEKVLNFWKKNKIFEKSLQLRKDEKLFNFYDGPPFATGLPHYGHILAMAIKDAVVRYKTMRGYYVPRKFGWDCHGLPVENLIEKELKISGKPDIEKMGVGKFNNACRKSVLKYTNEWRKTIDRMGRWGDLDNVYITMDNDYIESIWHVFKKIWEKDLVYKGFKSMPYCPRCGTPLSNFETNLGYKENTVDPSIFVKFKLKNQKNTYFLVWTTTPWTLPGNAALAVGKDIDYIKIKLGNEYLILAESRKEVIEDKYTVTERIIGKKLIGLEYEPLYNYFEFSQKAYYVKDANLVSTEDGTGIVHIAPAFGEDDLFFGKKHNLPLIQHVDTDGNMKSEVKKWPGLFVKDADPKIIKDLVDRGLMYKHGRIKHTYPFCWRCDSPLIYYAISTWFISASKIRNQLVNNNSKIHWVPEHIQKGRFGRWLKEAKDWAVTRNRYWGAPVPIWKCQKCEQYKCIGSRNDLDKLSVRKLNKKIDFHKPEIDKIELNCECGGKMTRVEEVFDCWFESGSMPYAQYHWPFNEKVDFDKRFPADFIAEGLDQTRGWFYTLHVISTILFDKPAFKNCIVNGIVLAKDGKKLSKKLRNYPEPSEVFDKQGADALRWFLLSSPAAAAEDVRFSDDMVADTVRRVILIYWNIYTFFINYAIVDAWDYKKSVKSKNILDKWILSYFNQTLTNTTEHFDNYHLAKGLREIESFITDFSTWYLRRSRKRRDREFYSTIYNVLLKLTIIMSPFMPFITEEVYQNLNVKKSKFSKSVHLNNWPEFDKKETDNNLIEKMRKVRQVVEGVHSLRKRYEIKVRQPLAKLVINKADLTNNQLLQIISEEVNVKSVSENDKDTKGFKKLTINHMQIFLDIQLTDELINEGLMRDFVRNVQILRKQCNLSPSDKVNIFYKTNDRKINDVISLYQKEILSQTIANSITDNIPENTKKTITKNQVTIGIS